MKKFLQLFLTFIKIGAFTFGGGYAMIPLIQREVVTRKKWLSEKDILDVVAIAESTPGPIAVNAATFVGYRVAGFGGAAAATFGVILPSFLIIFVLSFILRQFENARIVKYAFFGIRASVLALVIHACITMFRAIDKNAVSMLIIAGALLSVTIFDINVLFVILAAAAIGLVCTLSTGAGKEADR